MGDARAIVDAASDGNLEAVRRLVQRNRGLLDANNRSWTPLTAASRWGRVDVTRFLLDEGAQLGLRDPEGWTALEAACRHGHLGTASLLLAHGADAGAAEPGWGSTALMRACEQFHANIVALLLAHGCGDIDRQDTCSLTALHRALSKEEHAGVVVRALLGAGADPHIMHHRFGTPLAMAVAIGHDDDDQCVAELQAWECRYLLTKARRLRDASGRLHAKQAASTAISTASSQVPAYVASRVGGGRALPEVEVATTQREWGRRMGAAGDEQLVREAVLRHVVEGLRAELVRELVGVMGV